jgi:hypothetical protein
MPCTPSGSSRNRRRYKEGGRQKIILFLNFPKKKKIKVTCVCLPRYRFVYDTSGWPARITLNSSSGIMYVSPIMGSSLYTYHRYSVLSGDVPCTTAAGKIRR